MTIPIQCPKCSFKGKVPSALVGASVDCPKCKTSFVAEQANDQHTFTASKPTQLIKAPAYKPDEIVTYKKRGVFVSNIRLRVDDQTYAMSNITSVKSWEREPDYTQANFGIVAAAIFGMFAFVFFALAVANKSGVMFMMALGLVLLVVPIGDLARNKFRNAKPKYYFAITTAGEEVQVLGDHDEELIDNIVHAINEAILARG